MIPPPDVGGDAPAASVTPVITAWVRSFPDPITRDDGLARLDQAIKIGMTILIGHANDPNGAPAEEPNLELRAIKRAVQAAKLLRAAWATRPASYSVKRGGTEYQDVIRVGSKIFIEAAGRMAAEGVRLEAIRSIPKYVADSAKDVAKTIAELPRSLVPDLSFGTKALLVAGGALVLLIVGRRVIG
jgi:hypothetical protein